jgi:hypothetical protein
MTSLGGGPGYYSLINATPYTWHNLYHHSYQLSTWTFPDVVNPGKQIPKKKKKVLQIDSNHLGQLAQAFVELGDGTKGDDAGEVNYSVVGFSDSI